MKIRVFPTRFVAALLLVAYMNVSVAVGFGSESVKSFIGENLYIEIPILNISNTKELEIAAVAHAPENISDIDVEIRNEGDHLIASLRSKSIVSEPYLEFTVSLTDSKASLSKEFTVLLDIKPKVKQQTAQVSTPYFSQEKKSYQTGTILGSVMGPYEWASPENIPEQFGPVLDGQSLWRVARRLNEAFGVSIEQMMWGLYEANSEAFSEPSVKSLIAGTILNVPNIGVIQSNSHNQVLSKIEGNLNSPSQVKSSEVIELAQNELVKSDLPISDSLEELELGTGLVSDVETEKEITGNAAADQRFKLLGTNDSLPLESGEVSEGGQNYLNPSQQELVNSLASTVGNLTQELIRKDKRIDFLQEKITALEQLNKLDGVDEIASQAISADIVAGQKEKIGKSDIIKWLILFFVVSAAILFALFRNRWADLKLWRGDKELSFNEEQSWVQEEKTKPQYDHPKLTRVAQHEELLGFVNSSSDDIDDEMGYEIDSDSLEITEHSEHSIGNVINFKESFEALLKEYKYEFARDLLELAKGDEVNHHEYHFNRLRLYAQMKDEEAFYHYYYKIEDELPKYIEKLQLGISQLVVSIGEDQDTVQYER